MACSITWSYSPARTCVSYKRKQINNISNYQQDWDSRAIYLKAVGHECWNHVQGQMCIISVILDFLPILLYCKVWTLNFKNNFTKVEIFLMRSYNQFRMTYCLCWDSLQVGMLALDGRKAVLLQKQIKRWKSWSSNDLTIFKLWDEKSSEYLRSVEHTLEKSPIKSGSSATLFRADLIMASDSEWHRWSLGFKVFCKIKTKLLLWLNMLLHLATLNHQHPLIHILQLNSIRLPIIFV